MRCTRVNNLWTRALVKRTLASWRGNQTMNIGWEYRSDIELTQLGPGQLVHPKMHLSFHLR